MDNLNFDSGMMELAINGDESRILRFNPENIDFQDALFKMLNDTNDKMKEFETLAKDYDAKAKKMDPIKALEERIKLHRSIDEFINKEIDIVFGENVSDMLFQKTSPTAKSSSGQYIFMNFFEALLKIVQPEVQKRNKGIQKIIADHKKKSAR